MNFEKYILKTIVIAMFFLNNGYSTKISAIRDGAEEILYGTQSISKESVEKILDKIDQPESNPFLRIPERKKEISLEIIAHTKKIFESLFNEEDCNDDACAQKIQEFLNVEDSEFDVQPLSFLWEEILSKYEVPLDFIEKIK